MKRTDILFHAALSVIFCAALGGCDSAEKAAEKSGTNAAARASEKPKTSQTAPIKPIEAGVGTPMAQRVAILGLLNKRNGNARDVELKPGEDIRIGKVVLRLRACEKTAPWENRQDQGAFVQMIVNERPPGTNQSERWRQIFSGWLFKDNPAANIVEHPIYDVWVKECRMNFPGEEEIKPPPPSAPASAADAASNASGESAAKKPSSAAQSGPEKPEATGDEEPETPTV